MPNPAWKRRYRRSLLARAALLVGESCAQCGSKRSLHFAHVRPTGLHGPGRGQEKRLLDVIKYPGCYMRLCVVCHIAFDRNRLGEIPAWLLEE
jgi:hypothetical protein